MSRNRIGSHTSVSLSNRLIRIYVISSRLARNFKCSKSDSGPVARASNRNVAVRRLARNNLTCSKSNNGVTITTTIKIKISKLTKKLLVKSDTSTERTEKTKMANRNEERGWKFQRRRNVNKYSVRDFLKLEEKDIKAEKIEEEERKESGRDTTSETSLGARTGVSDLVPTLNLTDPENAVSYTHLTLPTIYSV